MITTINKPTPSDSIPAWHPGFLALVPSVEKQASISFRNLDAVAREEAIAEAVAAALVAYIRLVERGRQHLAHPTTMAKFAVCHVRNGRHVGGRENNRDALSESARRKKRFALERLDRFDSQDHAWQEVVVEDRRATPADVAAARLDIASWLQALPPHKRKIAKALAVGERTGEVARKFGVSAGRVSQLRTELRDSWATFQGELPTTAKPAAHLT